MKVQTRPVFPRRRLSSPAVLAWLRLVRVVNRVHQRETDRLRARDLSVAQFDVLARVGAAPGITQQEVANSLLVTKGNVCQLLDRLERERLLRRQPDGRANRLFLTERGQQLWDELLPIHEAFIAGELSVLDDDEQVQLLRLLRKLDHARG